MVGTSATVVLVLGGGNALGAYQAGGYEALHDRGVRPDWVVGASTGAINGAIICGNAAADRVAALRAYWKPATVTETFADEARRTAAAAVTMSVGQPEIFAPRMQPIPWLAVTAAPTSLYDTKPLEATLLRLADFDRLNGGGPRFTATATDLETGEPAAFDTRDRRVEPRHVRASSALIPAFPPVEIDGRVFGDGGFSANLPIDVMLADPPDGPVTCFALDLLPLAASPPRTLGEAAGRAQDLLFAAQSRLALAHWQARFAARPTSRSVVTLLHLSYDDQAAEVAGKAFDFSPVSVARRWAAGRADVTAAIDRLVAGDVPADPSGLTVWRG